MKMNSKGSVAGDKTTTGDKISVQKAKESSNMTLVFIKYLVYILVVLALVPTMEELLYHRSFDWIRELKKYHTPGLTKVMNILSTIGDGESYVAISVTCFFLGADYSFIYLSGSFFMN